MTTKIKPLSLIEENNKKRTILFDMINELVKECSRDKELAKRYHYWRTIGNSLGMDPVEMFADTARRTIYNLQAETVTKVCRTITTTTKRLEESEPSNPL